MKVRDIMQRPVITVAPGESVHELCRRMTEHEVKAVVVIDTDGPQGLVTEHDVIERCVARGLDPTRCLVGEIMGAGEHIQGLTAVGPDTDTLAAAIILGRQSRQWLMVIHDRQLIGLVSIADLAKEARSFLDGILDALSSSPSTDLGWRRESAGSFAVGAPDGE